MPYVFSYGSLQDRRVQFETIGRALNGVQDELPGFELTRHKQYFNIARNAAARVSGTRYDVTDAELVVFDGYEADEEYTRVEVALASGTRAWVYLR